MRSHRIICCGSSVLELSPTSYRYRIRAFKRNCTCDSFELTTCFKGNACFALIGTPRKIAANPNFSSCFNLRTNVITTAVMLKRFNDAKNAIKNAVNILGINPTSDDYISYSTVLDLHLCDPDLFTETESKELLLCLYEVLDQNHELTKHIAWDLVGLVSPYLRNKATIEEADRLLMLFAENGNAKEVQLKCIEAIGCIEWESEGTTGSDRCVAPRDLEKTILQFVHLSKLLRRSYDKIIARFPSRFLSAYAICLLSAFTQSDSNSLDVVSVLVDFLETSIKPLAGIVQDDEDQRVQRKILHSFITYLADVYMRTDSLPWAEEIFREKNEKFLMCGQKSQNMNAARQAIMDKLLA
ncbi:UPF0649 protein [Neolecta irregularis DAH-3]|uniref:UPF0649 protein n=1 Tax=Neolecta irregularis (strain DAH-3) TaxID=1198029 RepID=A0A1U7LKT5_NEOID|nr:UPF0649 protein [Neolecta irregularis DAH-3]|eukprot:OLL23152.1 UPF0649 protein [Neolecta irregularis DAH-3]